MKTKLLVRSKVESLDQLTSAAQLALSTSLQNRPRITADEILFDKGSFYFDLIEKQLSDGSIVHDFRIYEITEDL